MLVEYSQKYQLNVNLQKFQQNSNIGGESMPDTILPLYWFDKVKKTAVENIISSKF